MATGTIVLPAGAAAPGDGSASNAGPAIQRVKSSASAPSLMFLQLAFDASAKEMCYWSFRMPADYASGPVLKVQYKMTSATSGGVAFTANIAAVTPGDSTDVDAKALAADNTATDATVPGTAGFLDEVSITLTNADSLAAGDLVIVRLAREVANAADTATGDCEVAGVSFEYVTT